MVDDDRTGRVSRFGFGFFFFPALFSSSAIASFGFACGSGGTWVGRAKGLIRFNSNLKKDLRNLKNDI